MLSHPSLPPNGLPPAGAISRLAFDFLTQLESGADLDNEDIRSQLADILSFAAEADRQLTHQGRKLRDLEDRAQEDALTGLANRRGLRVAFDRALSAANRYGDTGLFVLVDIADLDEISEQHGVWASEALLRATAQTLMRQIRTADIAARLSEGGFALVLPRCPAAMAERKVASLRSALRAISLEVGGRQCPLRFDLASAAYAAGSTFESAMAACERRLFAERLVQPLAL
jgi:diguanylate cyclase (GGDEF)-like protein